MGGKTGILSPSLCVWHPCFLLWSGGKRPLCTKWKKKKKGCDRDLTCPQWSSIRALPYAKVWEFVWKENGEKLYIYLFIGFFFPICGMRCWRLQGNLKSKGKRLGQLKKIKRCGPHWYKRSMTIIKDIQLCNMCSKQAQRYFRQSHDTDSVLKSFQISSLPARLHLFYLSRIPFLHHDSWMDSCCQCPPTSSPTLKLSSLLHLSWSSCWFVTMTPEPIPVTVFNLSIPWACFNTQLWL